jgi:hypothetical protein
MYKACMDEKTIVDTKEEFRTIKREKSRTLLICTGHYIPAEGTKMGVSV